MYDAPEEIENIGYQRTIIPLLIHISIQLDYLLFCIREAASFPSAYPQVVCLLDMEFFFPFAFYFARPTVKVTEDHDDFSLVLDNSGWIFYRFISNSW